jgi:hypothetical protein
MEAIAAFDPTRENFQRKIEGLLSLQPRLLSKPVLKLST